jgi:hypothetical protein
LKDAASFTDSQLDALLDSMTEVLSGKLDPESIKGIATNLRTAANEAPKLSANMKKVGDEAEDLGKNGGKNVLSFG